MANVSTIISRLATGARYLLLTLSAFFIILVLAYSALFLRHRIEEYGSCVRLPNGVIVSYQALFDLSRPFGTPVPVVRDPGFQILSVGNDERLVFSKTTVFWVDIDERQGSATGLVFQPDVGLVTRSENRALYSDIIGEAGEWLEQGERLNNTNVLGVLYALKNDPGYQAPSCPVPLVIW
ncbi:MULTISPECIES: hypothetical protein [unclassified Ruegeria]|uniref:hypothetical protein n=1 Tax=unclassified Ruegeria TaxID=2625375 RepID=UPI001491CADB|nr:MULTISPECIES: hypothetical protein [unclassified Ruegeria]NOD36976.1 hypothetical protein [Ruegeria sp. HKCCD7296]NOE44137.1 hypothetical protein [Ruegeria sp. HKCCD7319]